MSDRGASSGHSAMVEREQAYRGQYRPRRGGRGSRNHYSQQYQQSSEPSIQNNNPSQSLSRHSPSMNILVRPIPRHPVSYKSQLFLMAESELSEEERECMIDCPICCEPMAYVAVGKCRDFICWVCAAKMRRLQGNKTCSFCKVELESVLIMRNPFTLEDKQTHVVRTFNIRGKKVEVTEEDLNLTERFRHIDLDLRHYPQHLKDVCSGLLYQTPLIQQAVTSLFSYTCWHPQCTSVDWRTNHCLLSFKTRNEWLIHNEKTHGAVPCNVCLDGRKIFFSEQLLFTPSDLLRHFNHGDKLTDPAIDPHHRCTVCSNELFDLEAYVEHVLKQHVSCYICDRIAIESNPPQAAPAFESFDTLALHYRKRHYPCPYCDYLAFRSDAELAIHLAQNHAGRETVTIGTSSGQPPLSRTHRLDIGTFWSRTNQPPSQPMDRRSRGRGRGSRGGQNNEGDVNDRVDGRNGVMGRGGQSVRRQRRRSHGEVTNEEVTNEEVTNETVRSALRTAEVSPQQGSEIRQPDSDQQGERQRQREHPQRSQQTPHPKREPRYWEIPERRKKLDDLRKVDEYLNRYFHDNSPEAIEANRPFLNTLLMSAITQFFGNDGGAGVKECRDLSTAYSQNDLNAVEYLTQIIQYLWEKQEQYNSHGYIEGRRKEPLHWRPWRQHFPIVHPVTDILFLLVVASICPRPLRNGLVEVVADIRADFVIDQSSEDMTQQQQRPSSGTTNNIVQPSPQSVPQMSQGIPQEKNGRSWRGRGGRGRGRGLPRNDGSRELNGETLSQMDFGRTRQTHRNDRLSRAQNESEQGSSSRVSPLTKHQDISNQESGSIANTSLIDTPPGLVPPFHTVPDNLPSFTRFTRKRTDDEEQQRPDVIPSDHQSACVCSPRPISLRHTSAKPPSPSRESLRKDSMDETLPILATAELPLSAEIPFLQSLQEAIKSYIQLDLASKVSKNELSIVNHSKLPHHISSHLANSTKSHLSLLNNLSSDAQDYINGRSVDQILSLRAIYFLLTKQQSENISRDWGCRCTNVFRGLASKELGFLKAYVLASLSLLPQATMHEEFPALSKPTPVSEPQLLPPSISSRHTMASHLTTALSRPAAARATTVIARPTSTPLQPATTKPKYGGSGGVPSKISSSLLLSESHFPSLGEDGEPLKLTSAEQWAHRTTKQKARIESTHLSPSPRDLKTSSSSSSTFISSSIDFPSLSGLGSSVSLSSSPPKCSLMKNVFQRTQTNQVISRRNPSSKSNKQINNHHVNVDDDERVVGGVGPTICSRCGFGNPQESKECQLCSMNLQLRTL